MTSSSSSERVAAERVAIVGASNKPDRYSYKAFSMLQSYGHEPFPVHPKLSKLDGVACYPTLKALHDAGISIDTVTLYVKRAISSALEAEIVALNPKRVIFNPGAENAPLAQALVRRGIAAVEACTLVLLRTGQF